jgi:hypothetical protein
VPKNLYAQVFESNDEAVRDAQERLRQLEGDATIVAKLEEMTQGVIQRFEWAMPEATKGKTGIQ